MNDLFSVRMRSSQGFTHISGGERLIGQGKLMEVVCSLVQRALIHERGEADFINIAINRIQSADIRPIQALPISTVTARDVEEAHAIAQLLLIQAGVPISMAKKGIDLLKRGAGPGGTVMRGAVVIDVNTGNRLEPDIGRGVRVSRFDWGEDVLLHWRKQVAEHGFDRPRVWEAVALASKVAATPGMVAELCWSDDPSYITGYVASPLLGYVRVPHMKDKGNPIGGRIFFVNGLKTDIHSLMHFLQEKAVMIHHFPDPPVREELGNVSCKNRTSEDS